MFINIKSEYCFFDSLCKLDNLIQYSKEIEQKTLGVVSDGTLIGNLRFLSLCQENDIKPILGVKKNILNFSIKEVLVYAKNYEGVRFINELDVVIDDITKLYNENVYLVYDISNINLDKISEIFEEENKKNIYFAYSDNEYIKLEKNIELKSKIEDKIIFVDEIKFLRNNDLDSFTMLQAIKKKTLFLKEKRNKEWYKNFAFELVSKKYSRLSDKVKENTLKFIDNIEEYNLKYDYKDTLNFNKFKTVNFNLLLEDKLEKYLKVNSDKNIDKYKLRLEEELKVINKLKFDNYFLIMLDIIEYCNANDIMYGYGRGSAAGSLVSFLLDITKIDPLEYGLYFERFLNEKRSSLPDIDLDVSDLKRQEIINHLINSYGKQRVAKIVTINKYQVKSAFNELAKSLDYNKEVVRKISSKLNSTLTFEQNIEENYQFFSKYLYDPKFDFLKSVIKNIENLPKNTSIHAAGIIISAVNIKETSFINNEQIVYNEAKYLEQNGFIKFDILALSNLSFIKALETEVLKIDKTYTSNIELNEKLVYKNLSLGKTFGIFQLESTGIKQLLKQYKPENLMDIANIISLYRPGPMKNINNFLDNKNKYPNIKYIHEDLIDILKPTFGIFIFQEQIIEVVQKMASFTLQEADIFRVTISKKNFKLMHEQKDKFINQGKENGYNEKILIKIFDDIEEFANYGFNKAHAISYARLIYQLMYLKSKYPTIFYSYLFKVNRSSSKREEFLFEIEQSGIILVPPTIKHISINNVLKRGKIYLGLENIYNIEDEKKRLIIKNVKELLKKNDFTKEDFLTNVIIKLDLNNDEIQNLVHSGFLDALKINRKSLESTLNKYNSLDIEIFKTTKEIIKIQNVEDYSFEEKSELEKKSIGVNIKYNTMKILVEKFNKKHSNSILTHIYFDKNNLQIYKDYFVYGTITKVKEIKTKNNELMCFINIAHFQINLELVCFSTEYVILKDKLKSNGIFKIQKSKDGKYILKDIFN